MGSTRSAFIPALAVGGMLLGGVTFLAPFAGAIIPAGPGCTVNNSNVAASISGTVGDDVICVLALPGGVTANGLGGDAVYGEDGEDFLDGGFGDDSMGGGEGEDIMRGDAGNDRVFGQRR